MPAEQPERIVDQVYAAVNGHAGGTLQKLVLVQHHILYAVSCSKIPEACCCQIVDVVLLTYTSLVCAHRWQACDADGGRLQLAGPQ